jgi:hypothetical protein
MGANYAPELIRQMKAAGCTFVRRGKGDHGIWESPITGRRFPGDGKILLRHMANRVLKQAGLPPSVVLICQDFLQSRPTSHD